MGNTIDQKKQNSTSNFNKHQFAVNTHINDIFGLLACGYIRQYSNYSSQPIDIQLLCLKYYRIPQLLISHNNRRTLFISTNYYLFHSIHIQKKGKLTINGWNPDTKHGGILRIVCTGNITLESQASIDLIGKGYIGGRGSNMSGESYNAPSKHGTSANIGGGGGGKGYCAGGGGYGTSGKKGDALYQHLQGPQVRYHSGNPIAPGSTSTVMGKGGNTYGDKELTILHMGSGGGSIMNDEGGCGGGALYIVCFGKLILRQSAMISCNGGSGAGNKTGCGSGGTIHIVVGAHDDIQMDAKSEITAKGEKSYGEGGDGGDGRIRIQFMSVQSKSVLKEARKYLAAFKIEPNPYVG